MNDWYCALPDAVPPRPRCLNQCASCATLRPNERQQTRDPEFEAKYFADISREVERRFGVVVIAYVQRVADRLATGAERYGDASYLTKDVISELLEETPDVGGYAALETQKQMRDPRGRDQVIFWLREAAIHGAMADHAALMAAREARLS